jgi:hypothetical protein
MMPLASCPYLIKPWMTPREISQMGVIYIVVIAAVVIFKVKFNKPIELHPFVIKCIDVIKQVFKK